MTKEEKTIKDKTEKETEQRMINKFINETYTLNETSTQMIMYKLGLFAGKLQAEFNEKWERIEK